MPILDDNGIPITFDGLAEAAPPPQDEPAVADPDADAEDLDAAELTEDAGDEFSAGPEEASPDAPSAAAFDPDDETVNPYVARSRELEARLEKFERDQAEAQARQQQEAWTQAQERKIAAQRQILARAREMDPEQLTAALAQVFQAWNAEVAAIASQSGQALNDVAWEREMDAIAREEGLTPEEAADIRTAPDSALARQRARSLKAIRLGYEKKLDTLNKQVKQKTAARRSEQVAARQASGAERVGGGGLGAAPAAQVLTPLQILRQEINGDPNVPLRVGS